MVDMTREWREGEIVKLEIDEDDFEFFKSVFCNWQKKLNLMDWHIEFAHGDIEGEPRAWIQPNTQGRVATVGLSKEWVLMKDSESVENKRYCLGKFALHEVLHLLFYPLLYLGHLGKFPAADMEVHRVIWTLIGQILPEGGEAEDNG